jgi:hypothetical protein
MQIAAVSKQGKRRPQWPLKAPKTQHESILTDMSTMPTNKSETQSTSMLMVRFRVKSLSVNLVAIS